MNFPLLSVSPVPQRLDSVVESVDRGEFVDISSLPPPPGTALPHRSPLTSVTFWSVSLSLMKVSVFQERLKCHVLTLPSCPLNQPPLLLPPLLPQTQVRTYVCVNVTSHSHIKHRHQLYVCVCVCFSSLCSPECRRGLTAAHGQIQRSDRERPEQRRRPESTHAPAYSQGNTRHDSLK